MLGVPQSDGPTSHEPEYSLLANTWEALCQGDIFEWRRPGADPWRRLGIIITADCDLFRDKHRGILSYVPAVSLETFVAVHWLPDQLQRRLDGYLKMATDQLRKYGTEHPALTRQALQDWLERDGIEGVLAAFPDLNEPSRRILQDTLTLSERIRSVPSLDTLADQLREFVAITIKTTNLKAGDAAKTVWSQLESYLGKLPGDCFFLTALSTFHVGGFVVYLRRIQEAHEDHFASSPADLPRAQAVRISRLSPPYKYRLTQQLAAVFSDIGLPESYMPACRDVVRGLRATFFPGAQ